jgi:DNA-binding NarL/FixJ family response regulator
LVCLQAFVFPNGVPYQFVTRQEEAGVELPGSRRGSWKLRCEDFSQYYHLSPRERQILLLLARGRNAKYIEETLVVSNHTAKAHIYSIYRKVNVHSRQELLNTLENFQKRSTSNN